jgi:peptidoglycan/xylan/chitin deacetylase (PgdA/CDA1 family)
MKSVTLPIVLCIDVEPDQRMTDLSRPSAWLGFENAVPFIRTFRDRATREGGDAPRVAWFFRLDPQIRDTYGRADWPLREYRSAVDELEAAGDEIGVHTHAYRWLPDRGEWLIDHGTPSWVERCLDMSFAAFEGHFRRPVRAFRFGDRWMNAEVMAWLTRADVAYDLTMEPGHPAQPTYDPSHGFTGSLPDYRDVPAVPFRPSAEDFRRPGARDGGLVEIPITTAPMRRTWLRRARDRARGLPDAAVETALVSHAPGTFRRIVDHALALDETRHLGLVVRTGVFRVPRLTARVDANLRMLGAHSRAGEFRWVTPAGAMLAGAIE